MDVTEAAPGCVILGNETLALAFKLTNGTYSISNKVTGQLVIDQAGVLGDCWGNAEKGMRFKYTREKVKDALGQGRRLVVAMEHPGARAMPVYLFSYTVYEGRGAVVMGFGLRNTMKHGARLMKAAPLTHGRLVSGNALEGPQTLNGAAGAEAPRVQAGLTRSSPNSLLLTGTAGGKRRSVVWGGLAYKEYGKWVELQKGAIGMWAEDPVGRLVDAGQTYFSEDTFYLEVTQPDPFVALEGYGLAMRAANHARPNVYDFPTLCGWAVGALSGLGNINNSVALVHELELAQKAGVTSTPRWPSAWSRIPIATKTATLNRGGGMTPIGPNMAICARPTRPSPSGARLKERDGVPFTYFQVGLPSDDYAQGFPGHMLFNDISRSRSSIPTISRWWPTITPIRISEAYPGHVATLAQRRHGRHQV